MTDDVQKNTRLTKKRLQMLGLTVDTAEDATGLNFFSLVPQPKPEQLECRVPVKNWRGAK